jgi:tetratricopeptide (TPR) repeat protein
LRFRKGLLLHARGRLAEAVTTYEDLLTRQDERHFSSAVDGIGGALARHNLAWVYADLGDWGRAENHWRLVLKDRPSFEPARHGLAEILRRQERNHGLGAEAEHRDPIDNSALFDKSV